MNIKTGGTVEKIFINAVDDTAVPTSVTTGATSPLYVAGTNDPALYTPSGDDTSSIVTATGALIHIHGGPDLTLEEVNQIGELVTESMDDNANCIWGTRVTDDMKGKVTVMTIMTGVKSPWVLGKSGAAARSAVAQRSVFNDELGIEIVQ